MGKTTPMEIMVSEQFHTQSSQPTWPPIYVPLLIAGVMSLTALFLYNIYPIILGWLAAWTLGIDKFLHIFVDYPWTYAVVKDVLRGLYVLTTMAVLTFEFFVLVYILLDEVIVHEHNKRMIVHTARKATQRAVLIQLIIGFIAGLISYFFRSFDALWWLPSFWTASVPRAFYTALWELVFVVFATAFVFSYHWKQSVKDTFLFIANYKLFFFLWFGALFLLTWCPAWSLQRMGITSSALYVIGGLFLQVFCITLGLIIFFQQSGEFNS